MPRSGTEGQLCGGARGKCGHFWLCPRLFRDTARCCWWINGSHNLLAGDTAAQTSAGCCKGHDGSDSTALAPLPHLSLTQDYELEAEKLRSLLDLENGRSSHVSKRARLQSPAAKVREEVSSAGCRGLGDGHPIGKLA